ncbi:hypothetical protein MKX40_17775 [Paenibacillus sp. FSL R5-0517]|uniref:hypothetical protein n=1 Tax=Paenibacillus sp. FSL R5-0517 TaxID=2921647 RepID=UPI0030DDAF50
MKKAITLVILLILALPVQAFAFNMSKSEVEKSYFEDYNSRVREVKAALKKLAPTACANVKVASEKYKASINKYKTVVKSKASKEVIAKAKGQRDSDKKLLAVAKKECSLNIKEIKQGTNAQLKELKTYKGLLIQQIVDHYNGKDKLKEDVFKNQVYSGLNYIDESFTSILESLNTF